MAIRQTSAHGTHRQSGFTLLEVLVTVVIVSVGLLGLAGMQLTGLKYNQGAYLRSQATVLASDILDRMRANRAGAGAGDYNIAIGATPATVSCTNCTPADMASMDLSEWKQMLQTALPSGDGSVAQSGDIFTVTVQWDDSHGESAPAQLPMEAVL